MKIKDGCLLREIGGSYVVVVSGVESVDFRGMISLQNETAVFMYKALSEEITMEELCGKLVEKYDVTEEHAMKTSQEFVEKLRGVGIIE